MCIKYSQITADRFDPVQQAQDLISGMYSSVLDYLTEKVSTTYGDEHHSIPEAKTKEVLRFIDGAAWIELGILDCPVFSRQFKS